MRHSAGESKVPGENAGREGEIVQGRRLRVRLSRFGRLGFVATALCCLVVAAIALGSGRLEPQSAFAAGARAISPGGEKVVAFEDVVVGPGETWNDVVVIGGDLTVQGTVNRSVVVVGGDATIGSTAKVGAGLTGSDHSVVVVFGKLTVENGATIFGQTTQVAGRVRGAIRGGITDPIVAPWHLGAVVGWIASTIALAIIALIAIAIAPRQVAFVRDRVRSHPWSSLGWGALGAIIVVPLVSALLVITVIGIIVAVPWLVIGVPWLFLFGFVSFGAFIGRLILGKRVDDRGRLMAAGVLGVAILNLLRWIPLAGAVILALLFLTGFGATYVSIYVWLRDRRRRRHEISMRRAAEVGRAWPYQGPNTGGMGTGPGWVVPPGPTAPQQGGAPGAAAPAATPPPTLTPTMPPEAPQAPSSAQTNSHWSTPPAAGEPMAAEPAGESWAGDGTPPIGGEPYAPEPPDDPRE